MQEDQGTAAEGAVERRAALRRGAAVLAGVAGLGVVSAVNGPAANAAPGDGLVLGQDNDAATATTTLTSAAGTGTLEVSNTNVGAPLRIAVSDNLVSDQSVAGDIYSLNGADGDGTIALPVYTHVTGTGDPNFPLVSAVFTDFTAVQPIPIIPTRVLDTRTASGRAKLINVPAGTLDASGRIIGGKSVQLDLSLLVGAPGGVFANVAALGSSAGGFLIFYPADPRPGASTVNFAAGQTISNFSFIGLDSTEGVFSVRVFASVTTHVIIDVTAFAVGSPLFINEDFRPTDQQGTAAQRAAHAEKIRPEWVKRQLRKAGLR